MNDWWEEPRLPLSKTECCLGKLCHTCGHSRYVSFVCERNQTLSVAACCQEVSQLREQLGSNCMSAVCTGWCNMEQYKVNHVRQIREMHNYRQC